MMATGDADLGVCSAGTPSEACRDTALPLASALVNDAASAVHEGQKLAVPNHAA